MKKIILFLLFLFPLVASAEHSHGYSASDAEALSACNAHGVGSCSGPIHAGDADTNCAVTSGGQAPGPSYSYSVWDGGGERHIFMFCSYGFPVEPPPQQEPGVYMPEYFLYVFILAVALFSAFILFYPGRT